MRHIRQHKIAVEDAKLSPFEQMLEQTLKHYREAAWLGANSPLASPYLLHDFLGSKMHSVPARGAVLQAVLAQALGEIEDDRYQDRYQKIIRGRYFEKQPEWKLLDDIGLAENAYHTSRKNAIQSLGRILVKKLNPALRLEAPLPMPKTFYGRNQEITECQKLLAEGATVMITGPGGVGKTTLASHLAQQWAPAPVFWFTLRLGLNDHWYDLLFALGYFLHRCGESTLWGALLAEANRENSSQTFSSEKALEMARFALETLKAQAKRPLLCFDEVDLLRPAENNSHALVLEWLGSLRNWAPLLLIGQYALLDAATVCKLEGLSVADVGAILRAAQIAVSLAELQRIYEYTQGNPRLLELLIICAKSGESIPTLLGKLADIPPFSYLLNRVLYRLSEDERRIVLELTVFRSPAPCDFWETQGDRATLGALLERGLVQPDGRGGLLLLPAYQAALYEMLSKDQRQALHQKAAVIRAARGAYTAAAYHTAAAGYPEQAIWLWSEHQQAEINQGQGAAALQFLRGLFANPLFLRQEVHQELGILCAELERLFGDPAQALMDVRDIVAKTPILELRARTLEGMLANDLSDFGRAQAMHQKALNTAEKLVEARLAHIHKGLGWMYMRERDLDSAWREAQMAAYEAENFLGVVLEMRCEYEAAEQHYLTAFQLAQTNVQQESIAKTSNNLCTLYARQGQFSKAKVYLRWADECFDKIGTRSDQLSAKTSWAFVFNLAGEHGAACEALQAALHLFAEYELPILPWQNALIHQGLAEAYLGLGNLDEAARCAQLAIAQEETDILPDAYRTLGEIMFTYERLEEAEHWILQSLELLSQNPDPYLEGFAWRALAQVQRAKGNQAEAENAKQKALALFVQMKLPFEEKRTHDLLPNPSTI